MCSDGRGVCSDGKGVPSGLCTHSDLLRQSMLDPGWRSHCGHLQHLGGEGEQLADLGQTGGLGGSKVTLQGSGEEGRGGEGEWEGREGRGGEGMYYCMQMAATIPQQPQLRTPHNHTQRRSTNGIRWWCDSLLAS